jgi:hypothetical protein
MNACPDRHIHQTNKRSTVTYLLLLITHNRRRHSQDEPLARQAIIHSSRRWPSTSTFSWIFNTVVRSRNPWGQSHTLTHTRSAPHKQFATCNVVSIRPDTRQMLLLFGHFNVLADSHTSWATSQIPLPPSPDWRLMAAGAFREDQQQICYRRWHVAMMDSQQTADRPS